MTSHHNDEVLLPTIASISQPLYLNSGTLELPTLVLELVVRHSETKNHPTFGNIFTTMQSRSLTQTPLLTPA